MGSLSNSHLPSGEHRLLYIVHRVPFPPDKGDRIRAYHLLRFLAKNVKVSLACLADEPVPDCTIDHLRSLCEQVVIEPLGKSRWPRALFSLARGRTISEGAFFSPALANTLQSWQNANPFSAVLASASSLVPYLRLPALRQVPAVVDLVDVDSQKWFDYSSSRYWPLSMLYRTEGRRLRNLEIGLPEWAKAITLVSEAEANLYRQFADGPVHAITNGVDLDFFQAGEMESSSSETCIFVGALDYFPNIDAACWFCHEIWPLIHEQRPQCTLQLVGRRPVPAVVNLREIKGVEVIGEVPDVRPFLDKAALAVVPLRIARGLQNKVLEALAMKKAVIASPAALAALQTKTGQDLLCAGTPSDWRTYTLDLLNNPNRRQQLGEAGRQYVETHHNWNTCLQPMIGLLGFGENVDNFGSGPCANLMPTTPGSEPQSDSTPGTGRVVR